MKRIHVPVTKDKNELYDFLKKNKSALVADKKLFGKEGDAMSYMCPLYDQPSGAFKAAGTFDSKMLLNQDELTVKIAINTTNYLDTHCDVHIKSLWKRSLSQSAKSVLHLQSHKGEFGFVIADALDMEIKAYTEIMKWKELGFDYKGETEVLIFDSIVKKSRNPFMFEQYAKGYVKNHSVGMRYIKMFLCINSEEKYYREEKDNWDTYYSEIVNKEVADEQGFFWAVTEGAVIEGSAVVRGSNYATPTLETKSDSGNHSEDVTKNQEPAKTTPINYDYLIKNFKI